MAKHLCGKDGRREAVPCAVCEVIEDEQDRAFDRGWCVAVSKAPFVLVCDRESGHDGPHRGYVAAHDAVEFWR